MENKKKSPVATIILTIICILWMYPIVLILINSLKKETAITTAGVFGLPTSETWNGIANFVASVTQMDFLKSFWYSLVISVMSVVLIMLCCSMAAWYIVRVNGALSKVFYYLCVFSMVVPFQMVMFTLAKTADTLRLNNPYNICIIYLGFGAGLAVFMFTGFVKGIPLEIEEAALIDGCTRMKSLRYIITPIALPGIAVVATFAFTMSWNEYLYAMIMTTSPAQQTAVVAISSFKYADSAIWGRIMAASVLTSLPVTIIYIVAQAQLISGKSDGSVK